MTNEQTKQSQEDKFDFSWIYNQVESHLIFGPISRHIPFGWIFLAGVIICGIVDFHKTGKPIAQNIGDLINTFIFVGAGYLIVKLPKLKQAAIGWFAIKFALALVAVVIATLGFATSLSKHQSDALPNLLIGLIWIPWLEFIPKMTPHQKYITIGRLILSIPVTYLGIRSGFWHW